jgi:hypothetical protein
MRRNRNDAHKLPWLLSRLRLLSTSPPADERERGEAKGKSQDSVPQLWHNVSGALHNVLLTQL